MSPDITMLHLLDRTENHDKIYIIRVDKAPNGFRVIGSFGARKDAMLKEQIKGVFPEIESAYYLAGRLVGEKVRKGYRDIEARDYKWGVTKKEAMEKIDTSRLANSTNVYYVDKTATGKQEDPGVSRVGRSIEI